VAVVRVPLELRVRDPEVLAPQAGLGYIPDSEDGIRRVRSGTGFRYLNVDGSPVSGTTQHRLDALAVPPAWQDVWLCPTERGFLQATGRDDAGRKQYRYHDDYRRLRDQQKFDRLRYFPRALPQIRSATDEWLGGVAGDREYAVAAAVRMIDVGLMRVGNTDSAANGHHGATTLHSDHLDFDADDEYAELNYVAKSGKVRTVVVEDDRLLDVLLDLAAPDTDRLFWFTDDDGSECQVSSAVINRTIAELVGPAFTAKDFRTWGGSSAALAARADGAPILEAVDLAAAALGNTRAVARSSYVHPAVLDAGDETITRIWKCSRSSTRLTRADSALAKLLRQNA